MSSAYTLIQRDYYNYFRVHKPDTFQTGITCIFLKSEVKESFFFFLHEETNLSEPHKCDRDLVQKIQHLDVRREKAKEGSARRNIPPAELRLL
ncbi:hypothetical protein PITC_095810 [Penicillium italicum]|uniref:Uncharacterized protein n=1 Tax=Penicillium italicum TaxID=40296 RepID=A0A0A2KQH8_PENIT|nr:hypothetical protein PITC_095810 [Penicillium italicum]